MKEFRTEKFAIVESRLHIDILDDQVHIFPVVTAVTKLPALITCSFFCRNTKTRRCGKIHYHHNAGSVRNIKLKIYVPKW